MAAATWVQEELKEAHVPFQELHHDEAYTAQAVAEREQISGHRMAKVVVVIADGRPVELILPASRRIVLESVGDMLGAQKVRLASEAELQRDFADCEVGAIPALRHWKNVDVIMDDSLHVDGDILFQAGTHRDAVRMQFEDWFHIVHPRIERFSVGEGAGPDRHYLTDWDNG
jgi:Ala-tRNA(Pro) deacylase